MKYVLYNPSLEVILRANNTFKHPFEELSHKKYSVYQRLLFTKKSKLEHLHCILSYEDSSTAESVKSKKNLRRI